MSDRDTAIQTLRIMDKHDKLGTKGVVEQLQKPASEFGAGLEPAQARMIGEFLETKGANNSETLANMRNWFLRAHTKNSIAEMMAKSPLVVSRCKMLCILDDDVLFEDGMTGLDKLLSMPQNDDQTWCDGGRPQNIGWALDDIAKAASEAGISERDAALVLIPHR